MKKKFFFEETQLMLVHGFSLNSTSTFFTHSILLKNQILWSMVFHSNQNVKIFDKKNWKKSKSKNVSPKFFFQKFFF